MVSSKVNAFLLVWLRFIFCWINISWNDYFKCVKKHVVLIDIWFHYQQCVYQNKWMFLYSVCQIKIHDLCTLQHIIHNLEYLKTRKYVPNLIFAFKFDSNLFHLPQLLKVCCQKMSNKTIENYFHLQTRLNIKWWGKRKMNTLLALTFDI